MGVCRVQLRMQRQQIVYGLFHQGSDLCFLRIGGIDFDVQVLEHVIHVGGHIGGAVGAVHHHSVLPAHAVPPSGDPDPASQDGAAEKSTAGVAVEQETAKRRRR